MTPELVWGLMPRLLGVLYVASFWSLARQVVPLVGRCGIAPLGQRFDKLARDFPGIGRFFNWPTVFWFNRSDAFLRVVPLIGILCGLVAVFGGESAWWALLICWILYLSLNVCNLWFPWDTMLLEAGFLALFLPPVHALPDLTAAELPLPTVAFLFRWLVIRLMWGFAKLKFLGTKKGDDLYFRGYLAWAPLPTPFGWYLQHAPRPLLRGMYYFMWVGEVVAPLLVIFPGAPRLVGAALLVALMLGIWITGNWGHFNLGYIALCVCLLDSSSSIFDLADPGGFEGVPWSDLLVHAAMFFLFALTIIYFPFNSWVTQSWTQWSFETVLYKRPWLRPILGFLRFFGCFRLVGSYGVFPPNSSPPLKFIPVLEGSMDGQVWHPYSFAFMATQESSPPRFIAPYHPRIDHCNVYAGLGSAQSDSIGGLMFGTRPYGASPYSHYSWLHRLVQRVLEGEKTVLRLLGKNPFPDQPPKWVRVVNQCMTPTTIRERLRTGKWWHVRPMCVLIPPTQQNPIVWKRWIPDPECLHPDLVHWRRRSPALREAISAAESGLDLREAVRRGSDIAERDVREFWEEFVPFVAAPGRRNDWSRLPETAEEIQSKYSEEQIHIFERIQQRYVFLLQQKLEPFALGHAKPKLEVASYFHFQLALQAFVFDGEEDFLEIWRWPESAAKRGSRLDDAARLYPTAVFRWDMVRYCVLTVNALDRVVRPPDVPLGFGLMREFICMQNAGPQWIPEYHQSEDGEWTVPIEQFRNTPEPGSSQAPS